ncbi:MAG: threonylcarbamoyl-AMP synthase [Saprospiraceae bacterium]|nr:threonylcarbamoyl-AMP synthase [Saprospiraceae bacterium]MCB9323176.1 threonylcarbamoyl-AMP synthase [Lewinellaceae bacterium]
MIGNDIQQAKFLLRKGEVVGIPTETVYGLAANAFDEMAVAKIFAVKNRPSFDPLILHTSSLESMDEFVMEIPEKARRLAASFMPGPLTLLLPKKAIVPDIVTSGLPRVAIRIPFHPLTLELLRTLDFPLAAPSANPFGYISPTTAQHVADQLGHKIPYILDGGPCHVGMESTILGFEEGVPTIFRKGGLAIEAIEKIIGPVQVKEHSSSNPASPGMLESHYAPGCPVFIGNLPELIEQHKGKRMGVITFKDHYAEIGKDLLIVLSEKGDFTEAARHLFSGMRQLDRQKPDIILAELLPEKELGRAINDRLRRAASGG